jgi:hypothetical protein
MPREDAGVRRSSANNMGSTKFNECNLPQKVAFLLWRRQHHTRVVAKIMHMHRLLLARERYRRETD